MLCIHICITILCSSLQIVGTCVAWILKHRMQTCSPRVSKLILSCVRLLLTTSLCCLMDLPWQGNNSPQRGHMNTFPRNFLPPIKSFTWTALYTGVLVSTLSIGLRVQSYCADTSSYCLVARLHVYTLKHSFRKACICIQSSKSYKCSYDSHEWFDPYLALCTVSICVSKPMLHSLFQSTPSY